MLGAPRDTSMPWHSRWPNLHVTTCHVSHVVGTIGGTSFPGGDFYTRMTRTCLTIHGSNWKSQNYKPKLSASPARPALSGGPGATRTVRRDGGTVEKPKKTASDFNLSLLKKEKKNLTFANAVAPYGNTSPGPPARALSWNFISAQGSFLREGGMV